MMIMLARLTQPRSMVADKDLQGCFMEWEKNLTFYQKLTNKKGLGPAQVASGEHVLGRPADSPPLSRADPQG